ncbi:DUF7453 family protein [Pelagicoccus mobilis]|uniref:Uncharacterized protein n=1 Tax=Pelagicoccus mobilis TaxID=415221 RepID=A0A934RWC5_9BACT|nr:choice-of-anchor tandem repeat NxxGxxAF-containing protein [Pelagicoccus mobilis]MBK1878012.1 hypothetical protein [Pelagicoccus mobilis]
MKLPLASLACGVLVAAPLLSQNVSVELILAPGLTTHGGEIEYDLYSYPIWNSNGDTYFKSRFLDYTGDLGTGGYVFHKLDAPNTANPILRDDTGDFDSFNFSRFGISDANELFFDSATDDDASHSLFKLVNGGTTKIEQRATLIGVAPNGSAIARNYADVATLDIGRVAPGSTTLDSIVKSGETVAGLDGATIKTLGTIHYNPKGQIAFTAILQGDGIDISNDHALIRENTDGSLELIARESNSHPENSSLEPDGAYLSLQENEAAFGFNGQGHIAFKADVSDNSSELTNRTTTLWFAAPGEDAQLIARLGVPTPTSNAGTVEFVGFRSDNGEIGRQPILDATGNVYFMARVDTGEFPEPLSLFKWDGSSISKVIEFNKSLPLPEIEAPSVSPQSLAISPNGRIAIYGVVKSGSSSLAGVLWAQDDKGVFATVAARNVSQTPFERENLVTTGGDLGKITRLYTPPQEVALSGSEDGLSTLWWTPDERLLFATRTANSGIDSYYCLATIGEPKIPASGNKYTWDGGIETTAWNDIESGRTNWVDTVGARWSLPPNRNDAEVVIPNQTDSVLLTGENVEVGSFTSKGTLELNTNLTVNGDADVFDISLEESGNFIAKGSLTQGGLISSLNDGIRFTPMAESETATTSGTILAEKVGINATSEYTLSIDNSADIHTDGTAGIFAESTNGDILLDNTGEIDSANGPAFHLIAPQGTIDLTSSTPESDIRGLTESGIHLHSLKAITATVEGGITAIAEDVQGEHAGLYAHSTAGPVSVEVNGEISATNTQGIRAKAKGLASVTHEGRITSYFSGIFASSTDSDVFVESRQAIISGDLGGITGIAENGSATIHAGEISVNGGHAVSAQAENTVGVYAYSPINAIDVQSAIEAISSSGNVLVDSAAEISTFGSSNPGTGISVRAAGDITVKQRAKVTTSFPAVIADSSDGHVHIDSSQAWIDADYGGLIAKASNGEVEIKSGELNIGRGDAIEALAKGDVSITHNGPVKVIGDGNSQRTAFGIDAESTEGMVEINSNGNIDTTHNGLSTAISALAKQDILINSSGDLSTYDFGTFFAKSETGSIQLTHRGSILSTNNGRGLIADAPQGFIVINLLDSDSLLASIGSKNEALKATADQSISVISRSSIQSKGDQSPAVSLTSATSGVSFTGHNDIFPGPDSEAIRLSSPTTSTINLTGGDILSPGGEVSVIQFLDGTQNRLTNHASIEALEGIAIKSEDADVTIDNHRSIIGDIALGTGTNILTNHPNAILSPEKDLHIGPDGSIVNQGVLDLTRGGDFTLIGSIQFSNTSKFLIKQTSPTLTNWLNASKESTLAGTVVLQLDPDLTTAPDQSFQIMTALGLTGTFDQVHLAPLGLDNQEAIQFATQFPSRQTALTTSYTDNDVNVVLSPLAIDDYESWKNHFIPGETTSDSPTAAPQNDSDLLADPDQDGLSNLEEYAFGTHPLLASRQPIEYATLASNDSVSDKLLLTFPWVAENGDLNWSLEESEDLEAWETVSVEVASTKKIGEITFLTIEPTIKAEKSFLRLKINYVSDSN